MEDPGGNVIGAVTNEGRVMLPEAARFPRSELIGRARDLAAAFGVTIPAAVEPILPPA